MSMTSLQPLPQRVMPAATASIVDDADAGCTAPADAFADRASRLVAFIADGPCSEALRRREEELADWISRWREVPLHRDARHFVAEELGIIMRALNGPPAGGARIAGGANEGLCWVIARCMADTP
ncbi:MAG TPA: hypothetical protein VGP22_15445 [Albitalea sp.]|nr:hypothetical protein [Albitalea sp.]